MAAKRRRQLHKRTSLAQSVPPSGRPCLRPAVRPPLYVLPICHVMWLEILAAATIILSRAQRMQLTLVYGPTAAAVLSAHPLMMADPFSLIELLNKKGMLRGMAISSRAMHRVRMRRNRMRQHFDTKHCAGRHSKFPIKKASLQAAFKVERWTKTKRWTCFAKQRPGRVRLKFLATTYKPFPGALYSA